MRLLAEIRPGDVLVCYDLARWSRDQVFAVDSIRKLRDRGITVRFWRQPFLDRKPPGSGGGGVPVDLTGIIAWAAENERHQTRDRSMSNRRALRASGAFVEGNPPFGYTVQDRKLIPIPEYAPIVVRIFTDSLEGLSVRLGEIALEPGDGAGVIAAAVLGHPPEEERGGGRLGRSGEAASDRRERLRRARRAASEPRGVGEGLQIAERARWTERRR